MEFGWKHNVDPMGVKTQFSLFVDSVELIRDEIKKDGEFTSVQYIQNSVVFDEVAQIYVARNFFRQMSRLTTILLIYNKVKKLKKFLDTTNEPEWMNSQ